MYPEDNADKLVPNFGVNNTAADAGSSSVEKHTWIANDMDWSVNVMNTNVALIKQSLLSPYLSGSINVYKCPADNYLSSAQRARGWGQERAHQQLSAVAEAFDHIKAGTVLGND